MKLWEKMAMFSLLFGIEATLSKGNYIVSVPMASISMVLMIMSLISLIAGERK